METIIILILFLITFLIAFFLGRFSQPLLTKEKKKEMWKKQKEKVIKPDIDKDVQIISPSQQMDKEQFMEEAVDESR